MVCTYAFSSRSVICDPAVNHGAAARAAFAVGDYAGTLPHLYCAFSANPTDVDLHMLAFQAMVRCRLHSTSTLSEAVLDTLGNDRWESIAQRARESLAANPQDEGAATLLARATYFVSPPAERPALIERLQSINPQNPYALLLLAQDAATIDQDALSARRLLETVVTLAANDSEIFDWIANLYATLDGIKDLPRALVLYNEALRLNPELAISYAGRGLAQQELGDFAAAHADIDHAVQLTPFDYRLYMFRARLLKAQGDDAAALADFRRVLAMNSASYGALQGVAELGVKMNDLEARVAATHAFLSSHIVKPLDAALTSDTPVRFRLSGMDAVTVKAKLGEGQTATFVVEATERESVFPGALLVAPDGGALLFAHRTFDSGPAVRLPLSAATAGEYTLLVIFNGPGEQELCVRTE
jgi:tetratricopeptide (TPR) repeat protein